MQKRRRTEILNKQASLADLYPNIESDVNYMEVRVRRIANNIVSEVVERVQQQTKVVEEPLSNELPDIVKKALHTVALEKQIRQVENTDKLKQASLNEPHLDLIATLKTTPTRQTVTLKIANQNYLISSDADVEYMQMIAAEANLLLKDVKRELAHADKQSIFILALLNALDEKATVAFKLNDQEELLKQSLLITAELKKQKAVLERKIVNYKQKLADLASIFTRISERFSEYKADDNFSAEHFQKLVLQILAGEEVEDQLANRKQLSLQDCLTKEGNKA